MKIQKKWNFHQKRLFADRGIWQTDIDQTEIIRFKVDKAEDFYRRRLRLKRDFKASSKEYLNAQAYQERIRRQAETVSFNDGIYILLLIPYRNR